MRKTDFPSKKVGPASLDFSSRVITGSSGGSLKIGGKLTIRCLYLLEDNDYYSMYKSR